MNEMGAVGELHLWITFAGVCLARAWLNIPFRHWLCSSTNQIFSIIFKYN